MKIATFNANSIRSRLDVVLAWMHNQEADVLCVQETKVRDSEFPLEPFTDAGYHVVFKGQKAYNGVAIISREPARDIRFGFDDGGPPDETRLARATVGPITFVNTYVPQGRDVDHEMFAYKCEWFSRLREYFNRQFSQNDHVVWLGDINVAREPIDVHNPEQRAGHVCFHDDARNAFEACCNWGFVDVFRKYHPEPGQYTFYDYRTLNAAKREKGWRIDYILTSPSLADRCTDSYIDLEPRLKPKPSDHTFLVAEFDVK